MEKQKQSDKRNSYLKSLQQFVSFTKKEIQNLLQELDWTEESTSFKDSEKDLVSCPLDSTHRVASSNVDKHVATCSLRRQGYTDDSVFLPSAGKASTTTVVFDKQLQAKIILGAKVIDKTLKIGTNVGERDVPLTADRYTTDLTSDERRVLYDYVVSKTAGKLPPLPEFHLPSLPENGKAEPMTREQLIAAERDAKRRRIRHRSVKVHTKSKNYSEVLREVIGNQMMAYEDLLRDSYGIKDSCLVEPVENKEAEDTVKEKEGMEWLEYDFRTNPHIRWKYILEKEKRRVRREEPVSRENRQKKEDEKLSKYTRNEKLWKRNKYENEREDRRCHSSREVSSDPHEKGRSGYSRSDRDKYDEHRSHRSSRDLKNMYSREHDRVRSYYKGYREYDDHRKAKHARVNTETICDDRDDQVQVRKKYKSNEKEDWIKMEKGSEDESSESSRDLKNMYSREHDRVRSYYKGYREYDDHRNAKRARVNTETICDDRDDQVQVRKKYKSNEKEDWIKMEKGSEDESSENSRSSHAKKSKKRKKSKKKHKHKHKKNRFEHVSSQHSDTTHSSSDE